MRLLNGAAAMLELASIPRNYPCPRRQPISRHLTPIICLCNKGRPLTLFLRLGSCILLPVMVPTMRGMSLSYLYRTPTLPLPSILPRGLSVCLYPALRVPTLAIYRVMTARFCSLHLRTVNSTARHLLFNVSTLCQRCQL